MRTIEKAAGRLAGSGREKGEVSPFFSRIPLAADPACHPLAFSIVHTDREAGTGYDIGSVRVVYQLSFDVSK